LGGGFGGLACARKLKGVDVEVVLIDRTNHHLFQPLLYQVATAGLSGSDIAQPIRTILRGQSNLNIHMASALGIDLAARVVKFDWRDYSLEYDYLVIALGAVTNWFGHNEWSQHAMGLKNLEDAYAIRERLLGAFERAEILRDDPVELARQLTVVVIGGGATGVEMAGAVAELASHVLKPEYRSANLATTRVILIDAGERLLSTFDPDLSARAKVDLERMGVTVQLSTMVQEVGSGFVVAGNTRYEAGTIIWAAGVTAPAIVYDLQAENVVPKIKIERGRIPVGKDCAIAGHPNVFAIGDIAAMTDGAGVNTPGLAQGAMQMGEHAAKVIRADLISAEIRAAVKPFVYHDKGTMATIGKSSAVAHIGKLKAGGFVAWVLWLVVHLIFLVDLRSKLNVCLKWVWAYAFYRPSGRLLSARKSP